METTVVVVVGSTGCGATWRCCRTAAANPHLANADIPPADAIIAIFFGQSDSSLLEATTSPACGPARGRDRVAQYIIGRREIEGGCQGDLSGHRSNALSKTGHGCRQTSDAEDRSKHAATGAYHARAHAHSRSGQSTNTTLTF